MNSYQHMTIARFNISGNRYGREAFFSKESTQQIIDIRESSKNKALARELANENINIDIVEAYDCHKLSIGCTFFTFPSDLIIEDDVYHYNEDNVLDAIKYIADLNTDFKYITLGRDMSLYDNQYHTAYGCVNISQEFNNFMRSECKHSINKFYSDMFDKLVKNDVINDYMIDDKVIHVQIDVANDKQNDTYKLYYRRMQNEGHIKVLSFCNFLLHPQKEIVCDYAYY
jgi:hypothetical protein